MRRLKRGREWWGGMVSEFLQRVFDGAAKPLLLHLVENREVPGKELEEIAAILKKGKQR